MRLSPDDVLALLGEGEIEVLGLLPNASNDTLAATVTRGERRALAVYKPEAGENPLWDFPGGALWRREIAAYLASEALGWGFVPPTVARDGPYGPGSLQLFIDLEPAEHYLTLMHAYADTFRRVAAFDVIVNNADRKSGHCLLERGTGRIWVVDHGVCFHVEPKLRTVIWEFAGEPLTDDLVEDIERFDASVLAEWLAPDEIDAVRARSAALVAARTFPHPPDDRRPYPWPPV